ncbi:MAG: hypothetical protein LBI71_10125 [Enterobacteriaceae bacterium]|jgi:hypothetical protein|nr:hypothetical protein [Enterobacteriaceae bacterium]
MKLRKKIENLIELNEDAKVAADKICQLFEKEISESDWFDEDELDELITEIFGDDSEENDDEDDFFS